MKIFKKIISLTTVFFVFFSFSATVFAQEKTQSNFLNNSRYPYYIENYEITGNIKENNVIDIKQKISVNYNESRQGIILLVPIYSEIDRIIDEKHRVLQYKTKITDVQVDENFTTYTENGVYYIKIGTEGVYNKGLKEYTVSYSLDMGEDRVDTADFFYYSVIGTDWDCPIENANFTINFPKDFDHSLVQVYTGEWQSSYNAKANITQNDSGTIKGHITDALWPMEGVTIYTDLPQGYFVGTTKAFTLPAYIFTLAIFAVLAILAVWVAKAIQSRQITETVEFYAPDNLTSADIGYVIDDIIQNKDILSLTLWLASKKYIKIEEDGDKTYLSKTGLSPESLNKSARIFYDAIFKKLSKSKTEGKVEIENIKLENVLEAVKAEIKGGFKGEKALYDNKHYTFSAMLAVVSLIFNFIAIGASGAFISVQMLIAAGISCGIIVISVLISDLSYGRWAYFSANKRIITITKFVICFAVNLLAVYFMAKSFSLISWILPTLSAALTMIIVHIYPYTQIFTKYLSGLQGKLIGFKRFINEVEKEKLEELVMQSPEYFYDILPYAYVFGISDKWIKKFEKMNIETTSSNYNMTRMIYTTRIIGRMEERLITVQDISSGKSMGSSFSGGSFGGGGFSGGGFGGGGGRSW